MIEHELAGEQRIIKDIVDEDFSLDGSKEFLPFGLPSNCVDSEEEDQ